MYRNKLNIWVILGQRFLYDATYKAKVLAERNKSILRDYDNQIELNFGLMKLCVGEFECELARNNQ